MAPFRMAVEFINFQARHYESKEHAALIPSNVLQEKRKALIQSIPDANAFNYRFFKGLVNNQKTKKVRRIKLI